MIIVNNDFSGSPVINWELLFFMLVFFIKKSCISFKKGLGEYIP